MTTQDTKGGRLVFAGSIGALAGFSLQGHRRARSRFLGAAVRAAALVTSEVVARRRQRPVVATATVLGYRILSAAMFRDPQVSLLAERVRPDDLPFVVPLESRTRYVGTD